METVAKMEEQEKKTKEQLSRHTLSSGRRLILDMVIRRKLSILTINRNTAAKPEKPTHPNQEEED